MKKEFSLLEYNKLCADLLGWEETYNGFICSEKHCHLDYESYHEGSISNLKFHSDMNWIDCILYEIEHNITIDNYVNIKGFLQPKMDKIHTKVEYGSEVRKGKDYYGYICIITFFTFSGHQFKGYHDTDRKEAIISAIWEFLNWYNIHKN